MASKIQVDEAAPSAPHDDVWSALDRLAAAAALDSAQAALITGATADSLMKFKKARSVVIQKTLENTIQAFTNVDLAKPQCCHRPPNKACACTGE
ncbi:hypothetical protein ABW21_db0203864 [Orbilia brochopaga]|nr:hypothetical protein ABW21_db0203864 [Drechslerella brochopaga]